MNIKRTFGAAKLFTKRHAPEILVGTGIALFVGASVQACVATKKTLTIMDLRKQRLEQIHQAKDLAAEGKVEYSEEDEAKDLTTVNVQAAKDIALNYVPSVLMGAAAITSILCGVKILKKRNMALSAAYLTLDKGFKEYRKRVADRVGEETEREIYYDIREEEVVDEKTGEVKKVKMAHVDPTSSYARFFDESCEAWSKDSESNFDFIMGQRAYLQHLLDTRGYVFLNEAYERLGIPTTRAGQSIGWIASKEDEPMKFIDFGLFAQTGDADTDERRRAFVNGNEYSILLDFNVDGDILDYVFAKEDLGTGNKYQDELENYPYPKVNK